MSVASAFGSRSEISKTNNQKGEKDVMWERQRSKCNLWGRNGTVCVSFTKSCSMLIFPQHEGNFPVHKPGPGFGETGELQWDMVPAPNQQNEPVDN